MTTVLIVDDSKTARMMMKHWLKAIRADLNIAEAATGDDALNVVKGLNDLSYAIIDYNMPGMTGIELAQTLLDQTPTLRISLCTANIQEAVQNRAKDLGIHYIAKPVTPPKIKQALESMDQ